MLTWTMAFATVHSGFASFTDAGEKIIGERDLRALFAGVSLPLTVILQQFPVNRQCTGYASAIACWPEIFRDWLRVYDT
ncbi:hypothetical protein RND81_12G024600 [Saponaria officinalis]|uniref:Uncharacterized protein n=1 Tax=Saponaria officinalis TaxID=3572 RepID=A0AAW1H6G7_SAPOF